MNIALMNMITTMTTSPKKFKAFGRLRYSPTNNGKIIRRDGGTTKWWLVMYVCHDLGRYYRALYCMNHYGVHAIQRPAWDAHISIISNECPPDQSRWHAHEGKRIQFEYLHAADGNDLYVWLPVICEEALDIREELGLKRRPFHPLHLTIGNRKETS